MEQNVIIIGGGLAGLSAAIHLSKAGVSVAIIEKNEFPKHKVCGEYISNEVLPYFESLGVDVNALKPTKISRTAISTPSGNQTFGELPLGGFGISRYALDEFMLKTATSHGGEIFKETVIDVQFEDDKFKVITDANVYIADIVIGAFGKRSNIDQRLSRDFILKKSHWLAIKAHYTGDFPDDLVALHNFIGGYCGVSKVENNAINLCYLADYKTFKKYRNIEDYQRNVLSQNPHLKVIFENATSNFAPISISQISFEKKLAVENHILMTGDSAGLIHPLCGNGMAMAVHSAKIASELIIDYLSGNIDSRMELEQRYTIKWNELFRKRIRNGRWLASLMRNRKLADFSMRVLTTFPFILPMIIKQTHGKPLSRYGN